MSIRDLSAFKTTVIDPTWKPNDLHADVSGYITSLFRHFRDDRKTIENMWLTEWANYTNTPESNAFMRRQILRQVGNVKSEWRHKLNTGKAFEVTETIHSYLMQAIFPNKNWFDIEAVTPEYEQLARVVRFYMQHKLRRWRFMTEAAAYLRQLCICGTSVMALPWSDKQKIKFETLDIFDCFFNPREVTDPDEDTPIIRRLRKTRADIIEGINTNLYSGIEPLDVLQTGAGDVDIETDAFGAPVQSFRGVPLERPYPTMTDKLTILEFWGDIHLPYVTIKNVIATVMHGKLIRFVPNNYHCGKPFVVGTYIPVVRQLYGVSALQASMGLVQQANNVANQMADGIELAVNPAYTMTPDSTLSPDQFELEPGKVYYVDSHDVLRPLAPPQNNFGLSFEQFYFLDRIVDKNTGTGPMVGAGPGRSGERVTAEEIRATQQAGGNRLLGVYTNVNETSIQPILQKVLSMVQQYTRIDETVPVPSRSGDYTEWIDVGPPELGGKYYISPKGAEHIIEKSEFAQRRMDILSLILKLPPEIQAKVNIIKLVEDIIRNVLYEDPSAYFIEEVQEEESLEEDAPPEPLPITSETIKAQLMADGGQDMFQKALGVNVPQGALQDAATATALPSATEPAQLPPAG